jgi:hypothetical protein
LKIDPRVFSAGLAAAGASRTATEAGVSVAWYETSNVKSEFTYTRTVFDGQADGPRHAENALVFRLQLNLAPKL